jgi:hypothetical protein
VSIPPEERAAHQRYPALGNNQSLRDPIPISDDVIRAFLFEVVRAPLSRPADVDLLQPRVVLEDPQRGGQHALVDVFVALRQGEPLEVGEEVQAGD